MTDQHNVVAQAGVVPVRSMMHPLVEKILEKSPTAETLEKVMTMQREWEKDQAKQAFTAALVALKKDLPPYLLKDTEVEFEGKKGDVAYSHTSLAAAMEIVIPILSNHGFSLTWRPGTNDKGGVTVTAILEHCQGHSKEATLTAPPDLSGRKSSAQGIASTITLLERYSGLALLGLASRDMKEPGAASAEIDETIVDTARNMRALNDLVKHGKSKEACEKYVSKPLTAWTITELDKLRAWISPPPPAASTPAADLSTDSDPITADEIANIKAMRLKWKLTPDQMGAIITEAIGRHPQKATDITKAEYANIAKVFQAVEVGAVDLKDGKIVRPPPASEAELNAQAEAEGVPF